jgi:hypothetical protein
MVIKIKNFLTFFSNTTRGVTGSELFHGFIGEFARATSPEVKVFVDVACTKWNVHFRNSKEERRNETPGKILRLYRISLTKELAKMEGIKDTETLISLDVKKGRYITLT